MVNCSLFNPTPSLASIVINHYKMKDSIQSYSLGGMGCSAGVISIHLAKDLLQVYPRRRALVISTENITQNFYRGNEKSMLITNTLFRMGGAAVLLSGRHADRRRSKYTLLHTVRTHKGADADAYNCVFQDEDADGNVGVRLRKNVMDCAGEAMKTNITVLGPLILPITEQVRFVANFAMRKWLKMKSVKGYVPDFTTAIDHFCIHTGGRAVLDAIQANLSLSDYYLEPSRYSLWRWGNVSSASVWYEMDFLERSGRIRYGNGRGVRAWHGPPHAWRTRAGTTEQARRENLADCLWQRLQVQLRHLGGQQGLGGVTAGLRSGDRTPVTWCTLLGPGGHVAENPPAQWTKSGGAVRSLTTADSLRPGRWHWVAGGPHCPDPWRMGPVQVASRPSPSPRPALRSQSRLLPGATCQKPRQRRTMTSDAVVHAPTFTARCRSSRPHVRGAGGRTWPPLGPGGAGGDAGLLSAESVPHVELFV